jgi:acyl-CoA synthetase (AMP-forming)/AMP-acid ligase II
MSEITQKFVAWANIQPDKPFLIEAESGRCLTYRQCLASVQAAQDVLGDGPKNVFLSLSNGLENAVFWLAALTGGHLLGPLPPGASPAECARVASLFRPDVLVVEQMDDAQKFRSPGALVLTREECEALLQGHEPATSTATGFGREGRVCFMTSGTTGDPKCVLLTAAQVVWAADHVQSAHRLTPGERGLTVLPFSHVNAPVVSLCASLLAGSTVVIARRFSRSHFWSWVEEYDITWASIVPTVLAMLLSTEKPAFLPGSLRFVTLGQEGLRVDAQVARSSGRMPVSR